MRMSEPASKLGKAMALITMRALTGARSAMRALLAGDVREDRPKPLQPEKEVALQGKSTKLPFRTELWRVHMFGCVCVRMCCDAIFVSACKLKHDNK